CGIEPRRLGQRRHQRPTLYGWRGHAADQKIAVVVDVTADTGFGREPGEIALRDLAETVRLPGVDRDHEMAGESLHQRARAELVETLLLQRRGQRPQAGVLLA